jgi:hypothetical protein
MSKSFGWFELRSVLFTPAGPDTLLWLQEDSR